MLTHNNWIDITWDGLPKRVGKENLRIDIHQQTDLIIPFQEASDQVANEIASQHQNLYLALSGGSDSEHIANVLYRNKIQFTPLIIEYDHCVKDQSVEETWWAKQWCRQHKIEPLLIQSSCFANTIRDKQTFIDLQPRLIGGMVTAGILSVAMENRDGVLLVGSQLEYYPDAEQMAYLEPQLLDYQGFVMEESDLYIEAMGRKQYPWFFYWNPTIMAAFVNEWDTDLTMQENKAKIYGTSLRPKFPYNQNFVKNGRSRFLLANTFGSQDCGLLGTKQALLKKLVK